MTVDESYKNFVVQLRAIYDEREAANIADWVFESIAGIKRLDRITKKQLTIGNKQSEELDNALQRLLTHEPVQYVLGEVWFYKMKLKVNEHVLIPRPETEELVEWVLEEFKIQNSNFKILDVGTGSGCIAVALKKELPAAEVSAIDVSADALTIAKENAEDQNVKIDFINIDFLNEQLWSSLTSFNIIVSNPPYIPEKEISSLAENVVEYEPHLALFVTDADPFIFYKKIAAFANEHLKEDGKVFVELNERYAEEVKLIFEEKNFTTEVKKDIYGRERMLKAFRS